MFRFFGKKYPDRAGENEVTMARVYAGPEQMGRVVPKPADLDQEPMKCVYAGPEIMDGDRPKDEMV